MCYINLWHFWGQKFYDLGLHSHVTATAYFLSCQGRQPKAHQYFPPRMAIVQLQSMHSVECPFSSWPHLKINWLRSSCPWVLFGWTTPADGAPPPTRFTVLLFCDDVSGECPTIRSQQKNRSEDMKFRSKRHSICSAIIFWSFDTKLSIDLA